MSDQTEKEVFLRGLYKLSSVPCLGYLFTRIPDELLFELEEMGEPDCPEEPRHFGRPVKWSILQDGCWSTEQPRPLTTGGLLIPAAEC
jgi:hypothetical protein